MRKEITDQLKYNTYCTLQFHNHSNTKKLINHAAKQTLSTFNPRFTHHEGRESQFNTQCATNVNDGLQEEGEEGWGGIGEVE